MKIPVEDGLADARNKVGQKIDVMHRGQYRPEHFFGAKEVVHVGARVHGAYRTAALLVQGAEICLIFVIWDLIFAATTIDASGAPVARGQDAVKRVDAGLDPNEHVFGLPYPQQVARLFFGQRAVYFVQNAEDVVFAKTPADAVAVEIHRGQLRGALYAQVLVPPALDDAVQTLGLSFEV